MRPCLFPLLAAAWLAATPAWSAEPMRPTEAQLKALCASCAVVTEVRTEQRKGKPSGVGAVGGAVGGAVIGKQVSDSRLGTVGGAVVGGLIGNEIEKRVKRHTVWIVSSTRRDGSAQQHEFTQDPQLRAGDTVQAEGEGIRKH